MTSPLPAAQQPSDLVTRLRLFNTANWPILLEAADRIEALEADQKSLRLHIADLTTELDINVAALEAAAAQPSEREKLFEKALWAIARCHADSFDEPVQIARRTVVHGTPPSEAAQPEREAALVKAAQRLIKNDDEERRILEPSCQECTGWNTPNNHDKGPCDWHEFLAALAAYDTPAKPDAGREEAQ